MIYKGKKIPWNEKAPWTKRMKELVLKSIEARRQSPRPAEDDCPLCESLGHYPKRLRHCQRCPIGSGIESICSSYGDAYHDEHRHDSVADAMEFLDAMEKSAKRRKVI